MADVVDLVPSVIFVTTATACRVPWDVQQDGNSVVPVVLICNPAKTIVELATRVVSAASFVSPVSASDLADLLEKKLFLRKASDCFGVGRLCEPL